jgi:hypothetical protein
MPTLNAIEKITRRAARIANGNDKIVPGQAARLSEAACCGDGARQGDLYLKIVSQPPANYALCKKPSLQLVPGNTEGAKHCLDSLDGVTVYLPPQWGEAESLLGPCLVLAKERTVVHPVHGDVTLPAGNTVLCGYQREWDAEQRAERRNAD